MNAASKLEMALLGLICQNPQSGYDLRKTFATTAWRHYSDSPGSIYPALKRMQNRHWIESATEPDAPKDPRRKQKFRPTGAGKGAFVSWLRKPLSRDDVRYRQHELLLRFAFMDGNVPRSSTIRFLDQFIEELAVYLAELCTEREEKHTLLEQLMQQPASHTGLLAFDSGIEGMEAQLIWARRTRAQLAEEMS